MFGQLDLAQHHWLEAISTRFRWGGCIGAALITSALLTDAVARSGALIAVMYLLAAPWLFGRIAKTLGTGARTGSFECLCTACVIGLCGLPPALVIAIAGLLLIGLTARDGPRVALPAALSVIVGWSGGRLLSDMPLADHGHVLGTLSVLLTLAFCVPIAGLAHRAVLRQRRAKAALQSRVEGLGEVADVLAAYLPDRLRARLFGRELEPTLERRWVTICFVDLVGFTALADRLAPESVIELLQDFTAAISRLTDRHGAVLDKFLGDGMLLFFTADVLEQRAARATACVALLDDLQPVIEALESRWRARGMHMALGVSCGVASGYCSVGDIGDDARRHYTVVGGPVNLASRLQHIADRNDACFDGATASLAVERRMRDAGRRSIRGLTDRVAVFVLRLGSQAADVTLAPAFAAAPASAAEPGSDKVRRA
jgi:class 3 adenylate cyclase